MRACVDRLELHLHLLRRGNRVTSRVLQLAQCPLDGLPFLWSADLTQRAQADDRSSDGDRPAGIVHVKVWAPDGTVLFSEVTELRGRNLGLDDDITEAIEGESVASTIEPADSGEAATSNLPPGTQVLEEYIPIEIDGGVPAVFEIYRNAAPILAAVDATRRDVVAVTIAAAAALAVMLYVIFRAAQVRLTRQRAALIEAGRRDALTGLLNHGTAVADLAGDLESARVAGAPVGGRPRRRRQLPAVQRQPRPPGRRRGTAGGRPGPSAGGLRGGDRRSIRPDEFIVVAPPACVHDLEPAIERGSGRRRSSASSSCDRAAPDHVQHRHLLFAGERRGRHGAPGRRHRRAERGQGERR